MKTRILLPMFILMATTSLTLSFAQSIRSRATKEFMRDKLEFSQRVLEELATEDYDLIIAIATRLSAMTKEADWRLFENPDYDQQNLTFRRQVDALVRSVKDKDLAAATLAYVRMTMSCVDCHKHLLGKLVAAANETGALREFVQEAQAQVELCRDDETLRCAGILRTRYCSPGRMRGCSLTMRRNCCRRW